MYLLYGTPLYVINVYVIRRRCRDYKEAFCRYYPQSATISYAAKAFLTLDMCRIINEEGLSLDVASAGELYTALWARFPASRIHVHGNCKTPEEIEMALQNRAHRIVVDNERELGLINDMSRRLPAKTPVLLRLAPGIEAPTHDYIKTGHKDTKFGLHLKGGLALQAVKRALTLPHIRLLGFHAHLGSQVFDLRSYQEMTVVIFSWLDKLRRLTGYVAEEINMGGGLGIRYVPADHPPSIRKYARVLCDAVQGESSRLKYPLPRLIVEPGRSIVGEAGTTLYAVHYVKKISNGSVMAIVDGGLSDNPRPALYSARYHLSLANDVRRGPSRRITVAGKHCEADVLFKDARLPEIRPSDILAVSCTGAYHYSMASNYNRYPRPAVASVSNGRARLMVRRESLADIVSHDM
ncbi:MAG: diaminopimelate decarboxylase [Elusimicrobia bacterium]|nr:diaminopimelate decarboxylase [Elusimicrobiota bacterium]